MSTGNGAEILEFPCKQLCSLVIKHESDIKEINVIINELIKNQTYIDNKLYNINLRLNAFDKKINKISTDVLEIKELISILAK